MKRLAGRRHQKRGLSAFHINRVDLQGLPSLRVADRSRRHERNQTEYQRDSAHDPSVSRGSNRLRQGYGGPPKLHAKAEDAHRIQLCHPPISFETFYEAMPDKNGEVWAGGLHSGRFWRFNPKNQTWTGYMMPEPDAHDRRTWIDNSTDPVTVWFVDHQGYMVRIQPLD